MFWIGDLTWRVNIFWNRKIFTWLYQVSCNLISFPNPIFYNLDFLPNKFRPLTLDILLNCINIIGKMILLSLFLFSALYSSPIKTWYSSLTDLINFHIQRRWDKELYTLLNIDAKRYLCIKDETSWPLKLTAPAPMVRKLSRIWV